MPVGAARRIFTECFAEAEKSVVGLFGTTNKYEESHPGICTTANQCTGCVAASRIRDIAEGLKFRRGYENHRDRCETCHAESAGLGDILNEVIYLQTLSLADAYGLGPSGVTDTPVASGYGSMTDEEGSIAGEEGQVEIPAIVIYKEASARDPTAITQCAISFIRDMDDRQEFIHGYDKKPAQALE
jgi:hypothetical protein